MLERITIQVPREIKEQLRKECFEKRTSYREILGAMLAKRFEDQVKQQAGGDKKDSR